MMLSCLSIVSEEALTEGLSNGARSYLLAQLSLELRRGPIFLIGHLCYNLAGVAPPGFAPPRSGNASAQPFAVFSSHTLLAEYLSIPTAYKDIKLMAQLAISMYSMQWPIPRWRLSERSSSGGGPSACTRDGLATMHELSNHD